MPVIEQRQNLIGSSETLHRTLDQVSQLAPLNRPALIIGERGTGKEMIAERLHFLSRRWDQPYLQVNCAALNENLLDSELFGHEAGAFTGASRSRAGLFERGDGGTLFLDELAAASQAVQEKLLRVIEYGHFQRLGGNTTHQVDVRVVAATNADLPELVTQGQFRGDLLDRLAFDVVLLPPLRQREDDILELADHFGLRMCQELGYEMFPGFSASARQRLRAYHWPGNVRELKNVVERSVYRNPNPSQPVANIVLDPFVAPWQQPADAAATPGPAIATPSLPIETSNLPVETSSRGAAPPKDDPSSPSAAIDLRGQLRDLEQQLIRQALQRHGYQQKRAAAALGLSYHQLRAALRKYPQLLRGEPAQ